MPDVSAAPCPGCTRSKATSGDYAQAEMLYAECLAGIASVVTAQGKAQQGAQLLSAAEALREASGAAWWPADRAEYEHSLALLHQLLDEAALATAWAEGRKMLSRGVETVVTYVAGQGPWVQEDLCGAAC